jgi:hypothetical protein
MVSWSNHEAGSPSSFDRLAMKAIGKRSIRWQNNLN